MSSPTLPGHASVSESVTLLGSAPGLGIVATQTLLNRPNYFDGRFLRADDLRAEQQYVRSLVALSNQAIGSGVAYGFDIAKVSGDQLRLGAGLALAPSGRVIHLPGETAVSIAELIERSTGSGVASGTPASGSSGFGPCAPLTTPATPDATVTATPVYLVTIAPADALCGDEELYGKLCEDACVTDSERSTVVEGVRLRVRPIALNGLPTSNTIAFTYKHLRSQVASAYFAAEPFSLPSLISGAGLGSDAWCRGAGAVGADRSAYGLSPDEVALGVIVRNGSVTAFVDQWTSRRELSEPPAKRWWAWRMAMRPWDAFLAQILQFQCQLAGIVEEGPVTLPGDPCEVERDVLHETHALLAQLQIPADDVMVKAGGPGSLAWAKLIDVGKRIEEVLAQTGASSSGSVLIDRGIVELPPAGYLPVDPANSIETQVRALMGPGVDLRFCAVRADYIPHALETVQHMERINLTQGIDDPGDRPEVDILVPDAQVERVESPTESPGFVGRMQFLPGVRESNQEIAGAALSLDVVARERSEGGRWGWAMAGYGEAPANLSVPSLFMAMATDGKVVAPSEAIVSDLPSTYPVYEERDDETARAARVMHAMAERNNATRRRELMEVREEAVADLKLAPGEARSVAGWLDIALESDLVSAAVGHTITGTMRLSLYSRSKTSPVLGDLRVTGTLTVVERQDLPGNRVSLVTGLNGVAESLIEILGQHQNQVEPINGGKLRWLIERRTNGTDLVKVYPLRPAKYPQGASTNQQLQRPLLTFVAGRSGTTVAATLGYDFEQISEKPWDGEEEFDDATQPAGMATSHLKTAQSWDASGVTISGKIPEVKVSHPLAAFTAEATPGALTPGSSSRDLGEAAIEIIAGELEARRPGFRTEAMAALFGQAGATDVATISGTRDWVLFHRRRRIDCGSEVETARPVRKYRLFHLAVAGQEELREVAKLLQATIATTADQLTGIRDEGLSKKALEELRQKSDIHYFIDHQPVSHLGFVPIATIEYLGGTAEITSDLSTLRNQWAAAHPGEALFLQIVGDHGQGDGEDIARARVVSLQGALHGLVTVSPNAQLRHANELPPEFRGTGMDGAFLFVTVKRSNEVIIEEEATLDIYKVNQVTYEAIIEAMERTPDLFATVNVDEMLVEMGSSVERIEVRHDAVTGAIVGREALAEWWGGQPPVAELLITPEGVSTDRDKTVGTAIIDATGAREADLVIAPVRTDRRMIFMVDETR